MSLLLALPDRRSLEVEPGPSLLAGALDGPGLEAHVVRHGRLPRLTAAHLAATLEANGLRGRGGAAFPFARKLRAATRHRGRRVVVVNLSEGEPASHKDAALARVAPHLVLDGAVVVAHALHAREVHLVLPGDRPGVVAAVHEALRERADAGGLRDDRVRWRLHEAGDHFVAGQSAAVLELMAGNPNLPVSTWRPTAERGHRGRPTLLSNAETFAHVAATVLGAPGTGAEDCGTTLLTLDGDAGAARVREVRLGLSWRHVLSPAELASPVLLGGYHGTWAAPRALERQRVSRADLDDAGLTLGAGVVLPLRSGCPVTRTARLVTYLAGQSAGRCGPCVHGLPALAEAVTSLAAPTSSRSSRAEASRLAALVDRRGACAHPDGTARLVRSLLAAYGDEVAAHAEGGCTYAMAGGSPEAVPA
jgi:NADH:ubiquinone oxidoreductase subunit F (NADH-binding)